MVEKPWNDRLAFARSGWRTKLGINRNGIASSSKYELSCGFWARTHYWTGWITEICLHDHVIINPHDTDAVSKIQAMIRNVKEACDRAALEFTETIPCVTGNKMPDGRLELGTHDFETKHALGRRRTYFPNDTIPDKIESGSYTTGYLHEIVRVARDCISIEDELSPIHRPGTLLTECMDRSWGYDVNVIPRESLGTPVSFRPRRFSVNAVDEDTVSGLVSVAAETTQLLFERYSRHGDLAQTTANDLPPAHKTRDEALS